MLSTQRCLLVHARGKVHRWGNKDLLAVHSSTVHDIVYEFVLGLQMLVGATAWGGLGSTMFTGIDTCVHYVRSVQRNTQWDDVYVRVV